MTTEPLRPETIEKLDAAVYPSFAMLAGMQLDLFTQLKDGPMNVEELAHALGVGSTFIRPGFSRWDGHGMPCPSLSPSWRSQLVIGGENSVTAQCDDVFQPN